jgi:hypothetical protein
VPQPEIRAELSPRIKCSSLRFKCNDLLYLNRGLPGSAVYDLSTVRHLLVSPYFLESDFIGEHELPPLLDAAKKEGLVILWVYISHCLYDETEIERYHAANEISKPLDSLTPSEQNRVLADVCRQIKAAATPKSPPQSQAEHDGLASAVSSYNCPTNGPLSSGPALGPVAQELLELIEQEPDFEKRGIVEILQEVEPGITHFFPRIQYAGSPVGMKTRLFRQAVGELVSAERIFPPETNPSTNTCTMSIRSSIRQMNPSKFQIESETSWRCGVGGPTIRIPAYAMAPAGAQRSSLGTERSAPRAIAFPARMALPFRLSIAPRKTFSSGSSNRSRRLLATSFGSNATELSQTSGATNRLRLTKAEDDSWFFKWDSDTERSEREQRQPA